MSELFDQWGKEFFPHLTQPCRRLAVMLLLESVFGGKENQ